MRRRGYLPLARYGLIGDCRSAALVGIDGSIDWLCLPRFDDPSIFGRILDARRGGYWQIEPRGPYTSKHRYRDRTNLLETVFATADGRVCLTDFMPADDQRVRERAQPHPDPRLVRIVECLAGTVTLDHVIAMAPEYGSHHVPLLNEGARTHLETKDHHFCVHTTHPTSGGRGTLTLRAGEAAAFSLHCNPCESCVKREWTVDRARRLLRSTQDYWWRWVGQVKYGGPFQEPVWRSALALKLMTYAPTGAIVAAPTTSLPERIGGDRNWDYRFTWLRDASFTLYAFFQLGLTDEADAFFHWLASLGFDAGDGGVLNLYRVNGGGSVHERVLRHLSGYRRSKPVRVGNAAVRQRQLDVYGELLDSAYLFARFGGRISRQLWRPLHAIVERAIDTWQLADRSIWEPRAEDQHFTYSKVMCWVAVDRGLRIAERFRLPHDGKRWRAARRAIHRHITMHGYSPELRSFTQTIGGATLDASMLRIAQVRFLPPTHPRLRSTIRAIAAELGSGVLVRRYDPADHDDGVGGDEGAFLMCSFWLVDALAHIGDVEEAQRHFERLLPFASELGLFAEEADPRTGELLGNFPQAFTHLSLVGAAVNIERARHRQLAARGLREPPQPPQRDIHPAVTGVLPVHAGRGRRPRNP